MLAQSFFRCQHRCSVLRTFRSRVVCQGLLSSGRSISSVVEGTCVNRVGSSSFVRRFNYGKIALGSKKLAQEDDLQERVQYLEKEVSRQSQTVAQLQNDVMNLLRNEVARLTEERSPRQSVSALQTVLRSAEQSNSSSKTNLHFADGIGTPQNAAGTDRLDIGERLGDLESQLGQLLTSIGVYNEAVASQQLHFDRLERFVLDYKKGDIGRFGEKQEIVDGLNMHLRSLLEGLEQERTAHGAAVTEILSRLDGIESRIRTQEAFIARLSGKSGVVRVGNWETSPSLGFTVPWLSGAPYSPIYANSSFQSLRAILDESLGISEGEVKIEFEEEDTLLEELVNIGVPGALWHASSEIVDDQSPFAAMQESCTSTLSSFNSGSAHSESHLDRKTDTGVSPSQFHPIERGEFECVNGKKPKINEDGGGPPGMVSIVAEMETSTADDQDSCKHDEVEKKANVQTQTSTPVQNDIPEEGVEDRVQYNIVKSRVDSLMPSLAKDVDNSQEPFIERPGREGSPAVSQIDDSAPDVHIKERWTRRRSFDGDVMLCSAPPSVEIHPLEQPRLRQGDVNCRKNDPEREECGGVDIPSSSTSGCRDSGEPYRCVLGIGPTGEAPESSDDLVETTSVCCGDAVVDMPTPRDLDDDELMYLLELSDVEEDVGSCDELETPRSPRILVSLHDGVKKQGGGDRAAEEVALRLTVEGFTNVTSTLARTCSGNPREDTRFDLLLDDPRGHGVEFIGMPISSARNRGGHGVSQQESYEVESPASAQDQDQDHTDRDHADRGVLRIGSWGVAENSSVFENPLFEEMEGGFQWGGSINNNSDGVQRWVNPLFAEEEEEEGVPLLAVPIVESPECHIVSSTRWVSFHDAVAPANVFGRPRAPSPLGNFPLDEKIALR
ncbi:hypothetical protein BSKO_07549 [Bryopsis sp. KO-2023]|nr:hypothetical protein BSKO_07549 [Bryopsis sp. KO-2023]